MELNTQVLQGSWNEVKGRIRERWGELTDDDLQRARGSVEQLVGVIQRKTGESSDTISDYLDELAADAATAAETTAEAMTEYLYSAAESFRESARDAAQTVRESYEQTEEFVRRRPMESLLVCFGTGLIVGAVVALVVRRN